MPLASDAYKQVDKKHLGIVLVICHSLSENHGRLNSQREVYLSVQGWYSSNQKCLQFTEKGLNAILRKYEHLGFWSRFSEARMVSVELKPLGIQLLHLYSHLVSKSKPELAVTSRQRRRFFNAFLHHRDAIKGQALSMHTVISLFKTQLHDDLIIRAALAVNSTEQLSLFIQKLFLAEFDENEVSYNSSLQCFQINSELY